MNSVLRVSTFLAGALFLLVSGCQRKEEPFYMKDLASLRRLPEEDLLRMRDDILEQAANLPDRRVEENRPNARERAKGRLTPVRHHAGSGMVRLMERKNGRRVICVEDFRVAQAPDLRAEYAGDSGEFRDLGPLLGNVGRRCFELPADARQGNIRRVRIRSAIFSETLAETELR